jgi:hypothetical protein
LSIHPSLHNHYFQVPTFISNAVNNVILCFIVFGTLRLFARCVHVCVVLPAKIDRISLLWLVLVEGFLPSSVVAKFTRVLPALKCVQCLERSDLSRLVVGYAKSRLRAELLLPV